MDRRDLPDLQLFQVVAEEGSFTRAALRLGRAQSGISQAIAALEQRIGVPLLARTTRNVRPTEAGQRLLNSLNPAMRLIEDGLTELREARGGVVGTLRLTSIEYPARAIMIPALTGFMEQYPNVTVDLSISHPVREKARAYLRVENLFDEDYQWVRGYGTSGRAVYAGLRASF